MKLNPFPPASWLTLNSFYHYIYFGILFKAALLILVSELGFLPALPSSSAPQPVTLETTSRVQAARLFSIRYIKQGIKFSFVPDLSLALVYNPDKWWVGGIQPGQRKIHHTDK